MVDFDIFDIDLPLKQTKQEEEPRAVLDLQRALDIVRTKIVEDGIDILSLKFDQVYDYVFPIVDSIYAEKPYTEKKEIATIISKSLGGFGLVDEYINDDSITEIIVLNNEIWIERRGVLQKENISFPDAQEAISLINSFANKVGKMATETTPIVEFRMPVYGYRVSMIIPPVSVRGPSICIRKFMQDIQIEDLVRYGTLTDIQVDLLSKLVRGRANIIVSGGTGTGKTTMLNCLSKFIPTTERIIVIEDEAELLVHKYHPHVVQLEAKRGGEDGKGRVTLYDLLRAALRQRPDRIIVGECRGPEALEMIEAMSTGHEGSMTTIHASNPGEMLDRLIIMLIRAGLEIETRHLFSMVCKVVDVVVQIVRNRDGTRRVSGIVEVVGFDGNTALNPIDSIDSIKKESMKNKIVAYA